METKNVIDQLTILYKKKFGVNQPKYLKYITIPFVGLVACMTRYIFWRLYNKLKNYPPGPLGLPFLGCLMSFGSDPRKFLVNIVNNYGPITYVPLMASNNIYISDPKILRQLYVKEQIINRPPLTFRPHQGIFSANGEAWKKRRQYVSTTIMNITNSSFILSHIKQSIKNIELELNEKYVNKKQLWYPANHLNYIAMNNLISSVFNHILSVNDPFIEEYYKWDLEVFRDFTNYWLVGMMTNFKLPKYKWLMWKLIWRSENEGDQILIKWMNNNGFIIDPERNLLQRKNPNKTDGKKTKVYVDFVIDKLKEKENQVTVYEIISDMQNSIAGGLHTTSKTSEYGFILLAKYPNIQEIVYNELQQVMNENNLKEFDFKIINDLHIFRAFIYEVLRISSAVPTGATHMTTKNHTIQINESETMVIPKYCIMHQNTYFIQKYLDWNDNNKILKKENNEIHLEYWLKEDDENGKKKFKMHDNFILFGVGKRNCVGQGLAMRALYAIFGLMINKYKFKSENEINEKQTWGFALEIDPPIGIKIERRF